MMDSKPVQRRQFIVSTGAAVAYGLLPKTSAGFPVVQLVPPPQGLPLPPPPQLLSSIFGFYKPPAPFTLVDFQRNPFQRPLGAAYAPNEFHLPGTSQPIVPKQGRGIENALENLEQSLESEIQPPSKDKN